MPLRAMDQDYLQSYLFHARAIDAAGADRFLIPGRPDAGFNNITPPEVTAEVVTIKDGQDIWEKKQAGRPTVNDCTFQRGVALQGSAFWDWMRVVVEGSGEYRATVIVEHHHRITALNRPYPTVGSAAGNLTRINTDNPAKRHYLFNAFPIRVKLDGDLDGAGSDISIEEIDIAYESVETENLFAA